MPSWEGKAGIEELFRQEFSGVVEVKDFSSDIVSPSNSVLPRIQAEFEESHIQD